MVCPVGTIKTYVALDSLLALCAYNSALFYLFVFFGLEL